MVPATLLWLLDPPYRVAIDARGRRCNRLLLRALRRTGVARHDRGILGRLGNHADRAPASNGGDNCSHSHVSYGVWGYVQRQIDIFWIHNVSYQWTFLGGGGLSGTRDGSGRCVHNTTVGAGWSPDGRFGWGQSAMVFDLDQPLHPVWYETDTYIYIAVGVLNATHGWGSCGTFACIEPGYILGYAVP